MSTETTPSQHTPGPWITSMGLVPSLKIHALGVLREGHKHGELGESICIVAREETIEPHDFANAALISAAPDLFACLAHLMERDWFKEGDSGQVVCCLDADSVRAALMKATEFSTRPAGDDGLASSVHGSPVEKSGPGGMLKPYQVGRTIGHQWGFKTPVGSVDGFSTIEEAERAAAKTKEQDLEESITGSGPIAEVLRKHFAAEAGREVA